MKRINKELLKAIIMENRSYVLSIRQDFIERERVLLPKNLKKVAILYGIRRSGKSFMLYHIARENPDRFLYVDFEDERLEGFSIDDFETLREAYFELFPELIQKEVFFLLDEIQIVPGWEKFCRRLAEKSAVSVIIAGSSSRIYPENIHTTLRGRSWSLEIFPLSYREWIDYKGIKWDSRTLLSDQRFQLLEIFNQYMKWGGFPEVVTAADEFSRRKIINEYLQALFFKDLVERYDISNITLMEALKNKIFSTFATPFSLNTFYKQTKGNFPFSKDLLFEYYQHLLDSKLIFEIRIFSDSVYKKMRNPPKVYIVDSTLAQWVVRDDSARILENVVFLELLKRNEKIHYFSEERECDFIVSRNGTHHPIQVTYTIQDNNREREVTGLIDAARHLDTRAATILTYTDEDDFTIQDIHIKVLPVWKWLLQDEGRDG